MAAGQTNAGKTSVVFNPYWFCQVSWLSHLPSGSSEADRPGCRENIGGAIGLLIMWPMRETNTRALDE
jgi:hypothetical protein